MTDEEERAARLHISEAEIHSRMRAAARGELSRRERQAGYAYAVIMSWLIGIACGVVLMGFIVEPR